VRARTHTLLRSPVVAVAVLMIGLLGLVSLSSVEAEEKEKKNKVAASGSETVVMTPVGAPVVLLSENIKTSSWTDLIIGVTLECSIITELTNVGNSTEEAEGQVRVWIEIDGNVVPVAENDMTDPGKVVFCNRLHRMTITDLDDEDAMFNTYLRTRSANAFNWMAMNVEKEPKIHTVAVLAELTTSATDGAAAQAIVGNRTMIIEPVKSAKQEAVSEIDV